MNYKPLNRREAAKILEELQREYGCTAEWMLDKYCFFLSEKSKVYIINAALKDVPLDNVRINSLGLYFCELNKDKIRLSIEGSQIIGKEATRNVYEVDRLTGRDWLKGKDIPCTTVFEGFVIVKSDGDFMGCGKYSNGALFNYVPKIRRIMAQD